MAGRHALLIGNSSFRHRELARLAAPANDVRALSAALENTAIGGFQAELKLDVVVEDAKAAVRRLFMNRHPDDLVLLYYSGHGLRDTFGRFYLAMTPTDPADPDPASIDEDWLRRVMNECAARRQVVILDCCHSAALIPGQATAKDAQAGPVFRQSTFEPRGHGRYIMAATTADASAYERDGSSLYTRHLVEGLTSGAAAPASEEISVFDLHRFVSDRVAGEVQDRMRPQLWRDADLNPEAAPLVIARNPRPRPTLDQDLLRQLASHVPSEVELAFYRLRDIIDNGGPRADIARDALRNRLQDGATLPFALGDRISRLVDPRADAGALANARQEAKELSEQLREMERRSVAGIEHGQEAADLRDALAVAEASLRNAEQRLAVLTLVEREIPELRTALAKAESSRRDAEQRLSGLDAIKNEAVELRKALVTANEGLQGPVRRRVVIISPVSIIGLVSLSILVAGSTGFWIGRTPAPPRSNEVAAIDPKPRPAQHGDILRDCAECPELVVLRAGLFERGSPDSEQRRRTDEGPLRKVSVPAFALGRTEVTFDQWDACVEGGGCNGYRPSDNGWGRGTLPVINVSWNDAQAYARWLSGRTGQIYRLPTEAEWEYGARSGTQFAFAFGQTISTDQANYDGNFTYSAGAKGVYRARTVPVATLPANNWGLREMHGNVGEWVQDAYKASYADAPLDGSSVLDGELAVRVLRGGSWYLGPSDLRSASRASHAPDYRSGFVGFRLARTLLLPGP